MAIFPFRIGIDNALTCVCALLYDDMTQTPALLLLFQ